MRGTSIDDVSLRRRRVLRLLAYFIGAFGLSLSAQINFLVPLRARELGAGLDVIGLIIGSGTLAAALSSVSIGVVIDRFGARRAFIFGAFGTGLVSLSLMLVTGFWWFIALQPLHGIVRNLGWVASQGYITSFATNEERALLTGRFSFFSNVGAMIGPLMTGAVAASVGFRWALIVPAVYSLLFAVIAMFLLETRRDEPAAKRDRTADGTGLRAALSLLPNTGIQVALLLTFARLWTSHVYAAFLPVFMVDRGIAASTAGLVMATSGLVAAAVAPTTGYWTRIMSVQTATMLGLGCNALGLVLAPQLASVPAIFIVPVLVGIGTGVSLPLLITIVTSVVPIQRRGVALGLRAMVNQVAATAAPVIIGPLMTVAGLAFGFATGGGVAALMLLSARLLHVRTRAAEPSRLDSEASSTKDL